MIWWRCGTGDEHRAGRDIGDLADRLRPRADQRTPFVQVLMRSVINFILAVFNMLPMPPLDGSKVLAAFLPDRSRALISTLGASAFSSCFAIILSRR